MGLVALQLAPDIVNLHMPYPPGDIVARAVRGRPALVLSYHSDVVRQQRLLQVYRPVLERTLARADRIIASSAAYVTSSPFLHAYEHKAASCRMVSMAFVSARSILTRSQRIRRTARGPVLLCVGVLRYYKGLHMVLEALCELDATLIIVGEGWRG